MKVIQPHTSKGPAERFEGDVYLTIVFTGEEPSQARMASVHFAPGAHTAWHSHAVGQYIHVVEGTAYVQERGDEKKVLKPGETIYAGPDVEHWHGASPDSFMVHTVVWESKDDGQEETTWLEHISDEEYSS
jgi:quercetin dioxygenase-like cupin family protein